MNAVVAGIELTELQLFKIMGLGRQRLREVGWEEGQERIFLTPPCKCAGGPDLRCSCHLLSIEARHDGRVTVSLELAGCLFEVHTEQDTEGVNIGLNWCDGARWADEGDYNEAIRQLKGADLTVRRSRQRAL